MKVSEKRLGRGWWTCLTLGLAAAACGDSDPTGPVPVSAFAIDVRYIGDVTASQRQAVRTAVARWQSAITGDLPTVPLSVQANACFTNQPAIAETIDDLLLYVQVDDLDGLSGTVAEAGPCYVRSSSSLPLMGVLTIDRADVSNLTRTGLFDDVVLHELGHVLGIGTVWTEHALLSGAGGADPRFTGAWAAAEYQLLSGVVTNVPVENVGAAGSRDGHWRESVFGAELMTSTLNHAANPLSAMTIASLRDIGYTTSDAAASPYSLSTVSVSPDGQHVEAPGLELNERLVTPQRVP